MDEKNIESKLDEKFDKIINKIETQTEKFLQMQDFSSMQTSLLAILFSLFIFSITVVVFYIDYNIFMTLFALFAILPSLPMILYLISSIFVGGIENKLFSFEFVLMYIFLSGEILLIILFIIGVGIISPDFLEITNVIGVFMMIFLILSIWFLYPRILTKFYARFDKLITKEKLEKRFVFFKNKLYDYIFRKSLRHGIIFGLLITIFSGLWENMPLININGISYGYPFSWLIYNSNQMPKFEVLYPPLFQNWLCFSLIIFLILISYRLVFKNKTYEQLMKIENKTLRDNWKKDPHYRKYKHK